MGCEVGFASWKGECIIARYLPNQKMRAQAQREAERYYLHVLPPLLHKPVTLNVEKSNKNVDRIFQHFLLQLSTKLLRLQSLATGSIVQATALSITIGQFEKLPWLFRCGMRVGAFRGWRFDDLTDAFI